MLGLKGKTAVVMGGSTRATAERPAAEGAHAFITGRRKTELDEAVGSSVTAVPGDSSFVVGSNLYVDGGENQI